MNIDSTLVTICGYVGSLLMVVFAFTMEPVVAINGLVLLTIQAWQTKMWNLVILNLVSIGGFASQIM